MAPRINPQRKMTEFAAELQEFLYQQRPIWTRPDLARATGIPPSTVTGWFIKGTFPEPAAFYALLPVLKWPPEKLMRLTGYEEMPPRVLTEWDFLRDKIEHAPLPSDGERARWLSLLEKWKAEYVVQPRTSPRRTMARKKALKAGIAAAATPATPAPTTTPAKGKETGSHTSAATRERVGAAIAK